MTSVFCESPSALLYPLIDQVQTFQSTCLPNLNDVFQIGQMVRPILFNSGQHIGSGNMYPEIKYIYFLVLLPPKMGQKA